MSSPPAADAPPPHAPTSAASGSDAPPPSGEGGGGSSTPKRIKLNDGSPAVPAPASAAADGGGDGGLRHSTGAGASTDVAPTTESADRSTSNSSNSSSSSSSRSSLSREFRMGAAEAGRAAAVAGRAAAYPDAPPTADGSGGASGSAAAADGPGEEGGGGDGAGADDGAPATGPADRSTSPSSSSSSSSSGESLSREFLIGATICGEAAGGSAAGPPADRAESSIGDGGAGSNPPGRGGGDPAAAPGAAPPAGTHREGGGAAGAPREEEEPPPPDAPPAPPPPPAGTAGTAETAGVGAEAGGGAPSAEGVVVGAVVGADVGGARIPVSPPGGPTSASPPAPSPAPVRDPSPGESGPVPPPAEARIDDAAGGGPTRPSPEARVLSLPSPEARLLSRPSPEVRVLSPPPPAAAPPPAAPPPAAPAGGGRSGAFAADRSLRVSVVPPPRDPGRGARRRRGPPEGGPPDGGGGGGGNDDDDDDAVEVGPCNLTNPTVAYPHPRFQCGVRPFLESGSPSDLAGNAAACPKCYCYVCDVPARECSEWTVHCHAHSGDERYVEARRRRRAEMEVVELGDSDGDGDGDVGSEVTERRGGGSQREDRMSVLRRLGVARAVPKSERDAEMDTVAQRYYAQVGAQMGNVFAGPGNGYLPESVQEESGGRSRERSRKDMSVRDVLETNFQRVRSLAAAPAAASSVAIAGGSEPDTIAGKMDGDIPPLNLHRSFFVEGVKIGWPYPVVMPPQRKMAIHLVKALKNKRHVVLESPTGTGKSAAILCAALAWQRYHAKTHVPPAGWPEVDEDAAGGGGGGTPKIVYCTRTHSQVAQMVASLKRTPYRPRMAVLGSRERMCVHPDIRPRTADGRNRPAAAGDDDGPRPDVNHECRVRVRNTEKYRREMWRSMAGGGSGRYDDDDPPETLPGDYGDVGNAGSGGGSGQDSSTARGNADEEPGGGDGIAARFGKTKTCPHYRQLTSSRVAALAHGAFAPNRRAVDCCSLGGEKTKLGVHDIEDLVSFGVNPHTVRGVAIYRDPDAESGSIGLQLAEEAESPGCVRVATVRPGTPAEVEGTIRGGDRIVGVNGANVRGWSLRRVVGKMRRSTENPLVIDISRGDADGPGGGDDDDEGDGYSPHSACPYYLSHALQKSAELIFAPYNYILDPSIRKARGIDLTDAVVVLDEAHNVEDTLRESGSDKFGEYELCDLLVMMNAFAMMQRSHHNLVKVPGAGNGAGRAASGASEDPTGGRDGDGDDDQMYLSDIAHAILLFLEKLILFLRGSKAKFESNPGKDGAADAIRAYRKFHTPDESEFEVNYYGPTGHGFRGEPVGCRRFFEEEMQFTENDLDALVRYIAAMEERLRGGDGEDEQRTNRQLDRLNELVGKMSYAIQNPEHYFISSVVQANGNLAYAAGDEDDSGEGEEEPVRNGGRRFRKKPRNLPFIPPRTAARPNVVPNICTDQKCRRQRSANAFDVVRHGSYCDGSAPKWEAKLVLNLLTPGVLMEELTGQCRTLVLASGSLAPIPSLCAELNLFSPEGVSVTGQRQQHASASQSQKDGQEHRKGRLQMQPRPLEAGHVVDLQKQLLAVSIGHFPDGAPLQVNYSNYSKPEFIPKLGDAIASCVESVPAGGCLIFLPSYSLLRKCVRSWNPNWDASSRFRNRFSRFSHSSDVWDRLVASKGKVIVETSGNQDKFEASRLEYNDSIRSRGSCVLLAVYRGKMSEGVSFNDDYARAVICVGVPLPNWKERSVTAKRVYNDEQRRLRGRTDLLPGEEWYRQQANRAIAQALGRCIRHAADYGAVILMDSRHCDDGAPSRDGIPRAHKDLPKWMRHHVRNLRVSGHMYMMDQNEKDICGGWPGLVKKMRRFFQDAKPHVKMVLAAQEDSLKKAQCRGGQSTECSFNSAKGTWSATHAAWSPTSSTSSGLEVKREATGVRDQGSFRTSNPERSKENIVAHSVGAYCQSGSTTHEASSRSVIQPMSTSVGCGTTVAMTSAKDTRQRIKESMGKAKKPSNTLRAMFDRQRVANDKSSSPQVAQPSSSGKTGEDKIPLAVTSSPRPPHVSPPSPPSNPLEGDLVTEMSEEKCATQTTSVAPSKTSSLSQSEEYLCVVCEEEKKTVLLLPCKHLCLCRGCSGLEKMVICPMCRCEIEDTMEVFM